METKSNVFCESIVEDVHSLTKRNGNIILTRAGQALVKVHSLTKRNGNPKMVGMERL